MKNKKEPGIRNQESSTVCEKQGVISRIFSKHSAIAFASCVLLLASCLSLSSCGDDDDETIAPKPRGYFRLTFPEKKYVMYDSVCPFKFEMPAYAQMVKDPHPGAEPCWLNLNFPSLNATVHLSYESVNAGNFGTYLQNTYELVSKHEIKASGIKEEIVSKDKQKVYGLIYDIGGNAASRIQFFLTDSTSNFIRGALYFNAVPNTDSLKPCVDFIKKDIYHLVETFQWKNDVPKPAVAKPMQQPAPVSTPAK